MSLLLSQPLSYIRVTSVQRPLRAHAYIIVRNVLSNILSSSTQGKSTHFSLRNPLVGLGPLHCQQIPEKK